MNWLKKFWKKLASELPIIQREPDFSKYSPRAQKVIELARQEAARFNRNFVGTEHLLLGLVALGQGTAVNVLTHFGISLENLRAELEKPVGIVAEKISGSWQPLTPRAKKVLALAEEERKKLNHDQLSTGHILLGILVVKDGIGGRVLRNLHMNSSTTRSEVLKELSPDRVIQDYSAFTKSATTTPSEPASSRGIAAGPSTGPATISNFTPRAQQVLALARKEADRLNHNFAGTEHLLLGLAALGQGVAVNVLAKFGISLETARAEVEKQIGKGPDRKMIGNIPYTPRVKKVLALAAKEAMTLNHTYAGTEHILLGLLREGDGAAARVLAALDINLEDARKEILKELDPNKPSPPDDARTPQSTSSKTMTSPNLPQPIDTSARYDVFCREQPDKLVAYRNVLFKSSRSFFPRPDAPTEWEYAELEEPDGQCVFVAKSTIVRFSPQGAAFEAEDI